MIKLLFLFFTFINATTHHYNISFMGLNVAQVSIASTDTIFYNQPSTIVRFEAKTRPIYNFLYPVSNHYETIHNNNNHQILSFKKITSQPGIYNNLTTAYENQQVHYNNSKILIQNNSTNIFSLLYLISNSLFKSEVFILEKEGVHYNSSLILTDNDDIFKKYKLNILLDSSDSSAGAIKHTDIFTWAIFKNDAERIIWVNSLKNRIEKCYFKVGIMSLKAEYLFTDE